MFRTQGRRGASLRTWNRAFPSPCFGAAAWHQGMVWSVSASVSDSSLQVPQRQPAGRLDARAAAAIRANPATPPRPYDGPHQPAGAARWACRRRIDHRVIGPLPPPLARPPCPRAAAPPPPADQQGRAEQSRFLQAQPGLAQPQSRWPSCPELGPAEAAARGVGPPASAAGP
jgi:hypothetical protein